MRIIASNIQLSSAHRFEVQQSVPPAQDAFAHGAAGDHDVEKLIKLLQRYLDGRPGEGNNEGIAEKIDRVVRRIEQRQGDGAVQFDLKYRRQESYREAEATSFRASGSVATADGRQIDFNAALDLARVYARTEIISLRATGTISPAGQVADPAEGQGPAPAPAPVPAGAPPPSQQALSLGGSALGLDQNGDGQIDVTTELVGQSGNGFSELAQYDEDGNGFIDEGDSIFSKLALVDQGPNGLTADPLAVRGVGAIYTGSVSTPYRYTDGSNQTVATLSRSGVYLNENGTPGIAQQVDVLI